MEKFHDKVLRENWLYFLDDGFDDDSMPLIIVVNGEGVSKPRIFSSVSDYAYHVNLLLHELG